MSSKIRKNIHIEILKYAQEHIEFTKDELMSDLKFIQEEKDLFVQKLINDKSLIQNTGRNKKTKVGEESLFVIATEGRFKLLEYEELEEARKNSKKARSFAIIAIMITAVVGIIQIFVSIHNNNSIIEKSNLPNCDFEIVEGETYKGYFDNSNGDYYDKPEDSDKLIIQFPERDDQYWITYTGTIKNKSNERQYLEAIMLKIYDKND